MVRAGLSRPFRPVQNQNQKGQTGPAASPSDKEDKGPVLGAPPRAAIVSKEPSSQRVYERPARNDIRARAPELVCIHVCACCLRPWNTFTGFTASRHVYTMLIIHFTVLWYHLLGCLAVERIGERKNLIRGSPSSCPPRSTYRWRSVDELCETLSRDVHSWCYLVRWVKYTANVHLHVTRCCSTLHCHESKYRLWYQLDNICPQIIDLEDFILLITGNFNDVQCLYWLQVLHWFLEKGIFCYVNKRV